MEPPKLSAEEVGTIATEVGQHPTSVGLSALLCGGAMLGWAISFLLAPVFAVPLLSLCLTMLSIVVHECAHDTLFPSKKANTIFGLIAGLLAWTPFFSYRRGHDAHHLWIGTSKDPTPGPLEPVKPSRGLDLALKIPLFPVFYWVGVYVPYLIYDLWPTAGPRRSADLVQTGLNFALLLTLHLIVALWVGVIPYLAISALGFLGWGILYENLFTLSQHIGLAAVPAGQARYAPWEQGNFSRSFPLPASALLFHFNLHKEHHLFPTLSFQRLPQVRDQLQKRRPDLYAFTDEQFGWSRRWKKRSHELLSPHEGDTP